MVHESGLAISRRCSSGYSTAVVRHGLTKFQTVRFWLWLDDTIVLHQRATVAILPGITNADYMLLEEHGHWLPQEEGSERVAEQSEIWLSLDD